MKLAQGRGAWGLESVTHKLSRQTSHLSRFLLGWRSRHSPGHGSAWGARCWCAGLGLHVPRALLQTAPGGTGCPRGVSWSPGGKPFVLVTPLWGQHTPLLRASLLKAGPGCTGTLHPMGRWLPMSWCRVLGAMGHAALCEVGAGTSKRPLVQGEVAEERVSSTAPWPKLFLLLHCRSGTSSLF